MSFNFCKLFMKDINMIIKPFVRHKSQRRTLGKPPGIARSLRERLEEINAVDLNVHYKVDIGFPRKKLMRKEIMGSHVSVLKANRNSDQLEQMSRNNQLVIPLEEVEEEWAKTVGPLHIKAAAEHYSVFEHLYGDAYFIPNTHLDIFYKKNNQEIPVFRGNVLKPYHATNQPFVKYSAPPDTLWTLIMTTPDCHFESQESEYVHWFVGNIKGGDVATGDVIWDYLQPFPVKGVGYCRYIFVLYKQEGRVDYSDLRKISPCLDLKQRTFSTYEFYRQRQDVLTPAGLGFFQADWDESVTNLFHKTLNMKAPQFAYDFPKHYHTKQKWFPIKQPFNLYLDRYRDEKQIAKEFVIKKLKHTNPFKPPEPSLPFPNAIPFKPGTPSWLKLEMKKERLKWGRINDY